MVAFTIASMHYRVDDRYMKKLVTTYLFGVMFIWLTFLFRSIIGQNVK